MPSVVVLPLLLTGLLAVGAPQARERLRGVARALDGSPWSDCHVVLVSTLSAECYWAPDMDRVETRADERGRFEAEVLPDRSYFVWAWAPVDEAVYRVSWAVGNRCAGTVVQLREGPARRARLPVRLEGIAPWRELGEIRLWLLGSVSGDVPGAVQLRACAVPLDAAGGGRLPPWPMASASLEVLTDRGAWPGRTTLDLAESRLAELRIQGAVIDYGTIHLDPPWPCAVRVASEGRAVAGAAVYLRWRDRATRVGESDAAGLCPAVLPRRGAGGHANQRMQVGRGGYGMWVEQVHLSMRDARALDWRPAQEPDATIKVLSSHRLSGRIAVADGRPARHLPFLLYAQHGPDGLEDDFAPTVLETDEEGRFSITCLVPNARYALRALLDRRHAPLLAAAGEAHLATTALLAAGRMPAQDHDLGDLRLDALVPLDVVAAEPDGRRGEHATVLVEDGTGFEPWRAATDRRGRLRILRPRDSVLALRAGWHGGFAFVMAPVGAGSVRLVSEPARLVTGRVVGPDGAAVPHAEILAERAQGDLPDVHGDFHRGHTLADAQGRFELRLVGADAVYTVSAWGGSRQGQSGPASVRSSPGDGGELVLRLLR